MKKLMILMFVCASFALTAQEKHTLGPIIGVNLANVSEVADSKIKPGLSFGLLYNYSINENWGVGLDLKYSQEGYERDNDKLNLDYIRVPLKIQYFFGELGQTVRPKIFLGPSFGFLAKAQTDINGVKLDVKDNTNSFDLGLLAGAGANFRIQNNIWFNGDVGYTFGLSDISEGDPAQANRVLGINVGVGFGF